MKPSNKSKWVAAIAGVGLCLALAGGIFWFRQAPLLDCTLEVVCSAFPAKDDGLSASLQSMPGVQNAQVSRGDHRVYVQFSAPSVSRSMVQQVLAECERQGYAGPLHYKGEIFDRRQRGTFWNTFWMEYTDLPKDDNALLKWLAAQPGVSQPTVRREHSAVHMQFLLATPSPPYIYLNILKEAQTLGYEGEAGYVHAFGRFE